MHGKEKLTFFLILVSLMIVEALSHLLMNALFFHGIAYFAPHQSCDNKEQS
jgi:hypothetical protein